MSGGGKSSSSQTSTSQDQRQVLDGGAIGLSGSSGNTLEITTLDAGAIAAAFDFGGKVFEAGSKVLESGVKVQEQQGQQLSQAYTDAKGTKDVLVIGALLVGAVSIAFILKK